MLYNMRLRAGWERVVRCSIYHYTRHKVSDDMAPSLPVYHERAVDVGESLGWIEFPQDRPGYVQNAFILSRSSKLRMCNTFHDGMPGSAISVFTVEVGMKLYIYFSTTRRFLAMLS